MKFRSLRRWFDRHPKPFALLFVVLFLSATILPLSTPPPLMRSNIVADPYEGLTILEPSLLVTDESPELFDSPPFQRGRLTIELEVTPESISRRGFARLITHSLSHNWQNWYVAQWRDELHIEHADRHAALKGVFRSPERHHLVIIITDDGIRVFRERILIGYAPWKRDPRPWKEGLRVSLGNDVNGDRPWRGVIHRLNFYDTPLTFQAARDLFKMSTVETEWPMPFAQLAIDQTGALSFEAVRHKAAALTLYQWPGTFKLRHFLSDIRLLGKVGDAFRNFLFLIPLGFFMAAIWRDRPARTVLLYVALFQFGLSFFAEMMQFLSPYRVATIRDIVFNTAGAFTGAWLWLRTRPIRAPGEEPVPAADG